MKLIAIKGNWFLAWYCQVRYESKDTAKFSVIKLVWNKKAYDYQLNYTVHTSALLNKWRSASELQTRIPTYKNALKIIQTGDFQLCEEML